MTVWNKFGRDIVGQVRGGLLERGIATVIAVAT